MFNKRLLKLVSRATRSVFASVIARLFALFWLYYLATTLGKIFAYGFAGMAVPLRGWLYALVAILLFFVFTYLAQRYQRDAGSLATATVNKALFSKLVNLGPSFENTATAGEATQLMGEGVERLRPYFANYLPQFFYAVLAPLLLFALTAHMCLPAALIMLVCVPFMPASIMMLMKRAKKFMGEYWGTYVDLGGSFLDAVRGLTTLKVWRADGAWHERLNKEAEDFRQITMKLLNVQLGNVALMDIFTYGGIALGLGVVCWQNTTGTLALHDAVALALLAPEFFAPMRTFGSYFHTGMNANAVIDRLFEILDAPEAQAGTQLADLSHPSIEVEHLSFNYADGTQALRDVSLEVPYNSLVGVTGESGSGKSTLARTIMGFTGAYEGSIRICGVELRDLAPASLQAAVTYVGPSSHVFKGSVRSNLRLAKEDATEAAMWGALKSARLDEFVLARGGLDMEIREGGSNLSGGQRQRLNFARAILRDTPIYIFDEVASNIDAVSENVIIDGIEQLSVHKTTLVISHRLAPLVYSDEICVLSAGEVVERGPHQWLMRGNGMYRKLWDQLAELERYAQVSGVEYDQETWVPSEAELRVAEIATRRAVPLMGAQAMQAALEVLSYKRYFANGKHFAPEGHPSWIPLPNYEELTGERAGEEEGAAHAGTAEPGAKSAQAPEPKKRSAFQIVQGLVNLTSGMTREVVVAGILGAVGNLLVCALLYAGARGLAGTLGGNALVIALALLALLRGPLHYRERLLTHDQTFRTLATIRDRVFGKLRELAPARIEARDAGDLISLLTSDIELLEGVYSRSLAPVLSSVATAVVATLLLAAAHGQLGLVALAAYVVLGIAMPALSSRLTKKRGRRLREYAVLMTTFLLDALAGLADLVQFGRARVYADEMEKHIDSLGDGEGSQTATTSVLSALLDALALVATCAMAGVAAALATDGVLPAAQVLALVLAFHASLTPIVSTARLGFSLHQTLAAADRILDVLDEEPETKDVAEGAELKDFEGAELSDVSFSYVDAKPALKDLSLQIKQGSVLRVIGPSGSGKSTLLKLLLRFWDPDEGEVRMNGASLRAVTTESLRASEAYMTQDTYLFAGTLAENIRVAKLDATDAELKDALEKAALTQTVARLPHGLETQVGAGGSSLSDGERQRVGLARAFLSGAPLMLLDEPTSNLDSLNEAAVLRAIAANRQGKTVIIASHRRATAAIADQTHVMQSDRRS